LADLAAAALVISARFSSSSDLEALRLVATRASRRFCGETRLFPNSPNPSIRYLYKQAPNENKLMNARRSEPETLGDRDRQAPDSVVKTGAQCDIHARPPALVDGSQATGSSQR